MDARLRWAGVHNDLEQDRQTTSLERVENIRDLDVLVGW